MCQLGWEEDLGGMHACVCIAESLCCLPETVTTLLIGYIPQYKMFLVLKNKNKILKKKLILPKDIEMGLIL